MHNRLVPRFVSRTASLAVRGIPLSFALASEECESLAVSGQAVMEGVMMRNKDHLAIAVREPDKSIAVQRRPGFPSPPPLG